MTHLKQYDWPTNEEFDIDLLSQKFTDQFTTFCDNLSDTAEKNTKKWNSNNAPYYNDIVKIAREEKISAFSTFLNNKRTNKEEQMWNEYKFKRNKFAFVLRNEKRKYYENKIYRNKNDTKKLWKVLKNLMGIKKTNNMNKINETKFEGDDDISITNKFNNFYVNSVKEIVQSINNDTFYDQSNNTEPPCSFLEFNQIGRASCRERV